MEFNLVHAGPDDVEVIVAHRLSLLREVHPELGTKINESEVWTREWIRKKHAEEKLIGLLAKAKDGKVAGSGCIWLREGVARLIVQGALKWCKERGYERVNLHASETGKPLYASLGFSPTTEMRARL